MLVNWPFFLLSLVLLFLPTSLLVECEPGQEVRRPRLSPNPSLRRLFYAWANWFDLARGALGAALLLAGLQADPLAYVSEEWLVEAGFLLVAVTFQMSCFRNWDLFIKPVFFLTGVTAALLGPLPALVAFGAGYAIAAHRKNQRWFLPVMAAAILLPALLVRASADLIFLAAALLLWPSAIGATFKKELWVVSRDPRGTLDPS